MEVSIDRQGRIVIPKALRERLGIEPGTKLHVDIRPADDGRTILSLRPVEPMSPLMREGSVLVHSGSADALLDPIASVQRSRADRIHDLGGTPSPSDES